MFSSVSREIGGRLLTLETGKLAQQAGGAIVIRYGDSVLLVTATMSNPREGIDFFPLTVDLEERMYARGKIPGSFFRREGRPSTHGTLIARMTDRPIRPLFPKGFRNEVQIIGTALSADQETPLDIMSIVGASAALSVSDIPFEGPIARDPDRLRRRRPRRQPHLRAARTLRARPDRRRQFLRRRNDGGRRQRTPRIGRSRRD